ncbi:MAG: AAA family ATPase [Armatimonadetes bacterium]|nr:AAA family ATPase [Armatimonadota bacterium]
MVEDRSGGGIVSERRVVAVLFADLVGFTAMVERLDPEVVTDAMNEIFAALGADVEAVGGHVDKVIGDQLMALFGAPVAHEDDALRAVRAALAMQQTMAARGERFGRLLGQAPRLRIGIHSGQVVWGEVGPPGQTHPTVMGDVVNLTARLQRAAPEGGILISESVGRQAQGAFLLRAWEPLVVRGKSEPVAVYEVLGERERPEPIARPPFIDRAADLQQLDDLLARAMRGRGQVVIIAGDPGVGKTRLTEVFLGRLSEGIALLQTFCPPYGGQSLGPLADLFRQFAGLSGEVTLAEVEARIPLGERAGQAAAIVSRLFGLVEMAPDPAISHETALVVAAEAIRRMLVRPTVVVIEDLQWADAGTREVLPALVERLSDTPLLLIGNLRAGEAHPAWGRRTAVTTLQLEPLIPEDSRALLEALLGERLPEDAEAILIDKAAGNPFYLSELVATLRRSGLLARDDLGRWRLTGPVSEVLPETIQAALLARLDRLAPEQRALLQQAAVVGDTFRLSLLAALGGETEVQPLLDALEEAYLIRRRDPLAPDAEFTFVHPLLREVAYNSLLIKHQVGLHRQVADAMERLYPGERDELAKAIGTHHDRGGNTLRALPYLMKAGRQAAERYASHEAIELLERVRTLAEESGESAPLAEACEQLGELYPHVADRGLKAQVEVWSTVMRLMDPARDPARRARAAIRAADDRAHDNQLEEARLLLTEAEALIPPDHPLWSDFRAVRAFLLIRDTKYREAVEEARQAVDIATRRGTLADRSRAYAVLGHPAILPLLGEEGREMMRVWVAEAQASGDERLLIDARHLLLSDMWTRGMVDEDLLRQAEETMRKAVDIGWTLDEATLRMILGWGHFLTGRWLEAGSHLGRAQALVEVQGGRMRGLFHILLPYFRGNLAMGYGRLEEARRIFEGGLTHARFHDEIWLNHDLARCLRMLGEVDAARAAMVRSLEARDRFRCIICGCQANGVASEFYAALGEEEEARPLIDQAAETATAIGHVATRIRTQRAQARLALGRGAADDAAAAARMAVEVGEALPLPQPLEQGQSWLLLGRAHAAAGEAEQARAAWEEARTRFSGLGASWHLRQVEEAPAQAGVRS